MNSILHLFAIANLVFASTLLSYAQAQTAATTPDPPTGISGVAMSPTSSKLSWIAPANNGSSKITGYKIEVKIISGDYAVLVANNANTTYTHTGLTTGKTYIYRVSAINSAGTSNPSSEVVVKPTKASSATNNSPTTAQSPTTQSSTTNNVAPGQPTGLTATMTSSTSILLSWTAPSNTGVLITGYKIEFKTDTDQWSVLVPNTGVISSYSITGLTTGTTYTYRVSTINSVGTSNPSNAISIATKSTTIPTALTAVATSPTSILLLWVAPSQNFGQIISGYKIERNLGNNNFDTVVSSTGSTTTSYTVTGLTTGKLYTFVVSAVYPGGTSSGPSNSASATPDKTSKPSANLAISNGGQNPSPGTPSVQMPSKAQIDSAQKKAQDVIDKAKADKATETDKAKAARDAANDKVIADAKAALQKRLAAAKNSTSIVIPNTEKQKADQKLKELQAENDKLNQRLKTTTSNHG